MKENSQTGMENNEQQNPTCLDAVDEAVTGTPGIIGVQIDPQQQRVAIQYDPKRVSEAMVDTIGQALEPTLQENFKNCTFRLSGRGGRACETCAALLERRVGQIEGVRRASASYWGGVINITYDDRITSPPEVAQKVRQLGARVGPSSAELLPQAEAYPAPEQPLARLWAWLRGLSPEAVFTALAGLGLVIGWLAERLDAPLVASVAYAVAYVTGGTFGVSAGLESLRERTIDVDLLMVLAAIGAALVGAPFEGALLLFLFSLSNVLQDYAMGRTRNAIRALMKLRPAQAQVRRADEWVTLPVEQAVVNDHFLIRPGDRIPLDGVVIEGESSVDQAPITGESIPVVKSPGDMVLAGTINKNGSLEARVSRTAQDSTIARLIKMVEEAQSQKAQTQRFLDRAEQYYATGVIIFTLLAIIVPVFLLGEAFDPAFYRAMTLMVAASPCALIISTPASILSAIGNGARRGILFKGGAYVERAAEIQVIAFDKTGTLTEGKPRVTDVVVLNHAEGLWQGDEDDLLALAAAVEARSEHHLARAAVEAAQARNLDVSEVMAFQAATGKGVSGLVDGADIRVGSPRYFEDLATVGLEAAAPEVERLQAEGKTAVLVAQFVEERSTAHILGIVAFADQLRPNAAKVVRDLKSLGVKHVAMLTGDNERIARAIAAEVGVDAAYADLLPEDKLRLIRELEAEYGAVAMVGDGVNDAPALASASIGIAMGAAGTDVALETADVVLMADDLGNIPYVIALSRQTRKTLLVNLTFAMAMIVIMIIGIFTADLPLPLAVIGHEGGTVLVSLNGLRLLVYKGKKTRTEAETESPQTSPDVWPSCQRRKL